MEKVESSGAIEALKKGSEKIGSGLFGREEVEVEVNEADARGTTHASIPSVACQG